MKHILLLATQFLCLLCAAQGAKTIDSKITDVTVFMSGAELHHQASISLKEGKQEIVFGNLSPDLNSSTIVVNIEPKDVTILSVSHRTNYLNSVPDNKRIAIVKDSVALTSDKMQILNDKIAVLESEKLLLFKNEGIGGTSNNVPTSEIEKAANFYRMRMNDVNEQLFKIRKEKIETSVNYEKLQNQLSELNAKYNPPTSEITLVVVSNKNQRAEASIKYQVSSAGWEPKYDVRSDGVLKPVELIYRANVYNNSGIDWSNVKLKLSTSDPKQGAEKPLLEIWDLAESFEEANKKMYKAKYSWVKTRNVSANGWVSDKDSIKNDENILIDENGQQIELVEVAELNADFDIPQPYTILSDAKAYIVDVTKYTMEASYEHFAVPKIDNDVFLTAKVIGWNALNLVSGNASVYYNGEYLGNSYINTASVEDTLVLSLGRDSKIKIQRIMISEENKKTISGGSKKETIVYETTVKNNREGNVTLTIEDQLPISSDSEIEVTAHETSGAELDKDSGKLIYKMNLAAGESKKIRLSYSIKSPKWRKLKQQTMQRSRAKF